jgi:hypothetical protein
LAVWKNVARGAGVQISALGSCFLLFISRGQLFRNAIHCASSFYCLFSFCAHSIKLSVAVNILLGKSHLFHGCKRSDGQGDFSCARGQK